MTDKAKFFELAAAHDIDVTYLHGGTVNGKVRAAEFLLDAPNGKIFCASGCHCDGSLSGDPDTDGARTDWRKAFQGLRAIVAMGMEPCTDGDACDICNPDTE